MAKIYKATGYVFLASAVLAHFIISLGRDTNFFQLITSALYWPDLAYVTGINFIVIGLLYLIHLWLEKICPLPLNPIKRLVLQFLWAVVLPSLIVFSLAYFYLTSILKYEFWKTTFMLYEYPVSVLIIITCNLFLLLLSLLMKKQETESPPVKKSVLILQQGDRKIPVQVTDIAAIMKEGEIPVVFSFDSKQFGISESLDEIYKSLDNKFFFRANRQVIININTCEHFTIQRSGKIELKLTPPLSREIVISQKRAQEFKDWIQS